MSGFNPNNIKVNLDGATINATIADEIDANITNTSLDVNVTNSPLNVTATISGTPAVTISGTPSVTATISGTPTVNIGTMPNVTATTTPIAFGMDASLRTRVSIATTLFDGKILNADNARLFQNIGTGTGLFVDNSYSMTVTEGQYFIRQARSFNPYFSGKSQLIELTADFFNAEVGKLKRFGYFSSNAVAPYDSNKDGVWLENDGTTIRLIISNNGSEKLNKVITQWDGYANLAEYQNIATWGNFTVIGIDFLWLGGAVLRLFVKTSTGFVLAHTFNYSGTSQGQFMRSPNQPVRYEIRSTAGSGTFRYICSQVATEGSFAESGETLSLVNIASITANTAGIIYALKGVRKLAAYRDIAVQIIDMAVSNTSPNQDAGMLMLLLNPTLSAPLVYATNSRIEEATATTQTISAYERIIAAISVAAGGDTAIMAQNFLSYLKGNINNTFDEYVLAYLATTANQSVNGVLTIKEY